MKSTAFIRSTFCNLQSAIMSRYVLALCLIISSRFSVAQFVSLDSVLNRIEQNNPQLISYQYKVNAGNALAAGAGSWMSPTAGIGLDQTPYAVSSDETFFNRDEGAAVLFLEQEIPNPSKQKANRNYLHSLTAIDSSAWNTEKNELFTEAKDAYIQRYIAEKRLKIINSEIDLLDLIIQSSSIQFTNNQDDLPAVYKAQARKHTLEAMRAHEKSGADEATATLNYLMNFPQGTTFAIDTFIRHKGYTIADLDTTAAYIETHRSDVQQIDHSIYSMNMNTALARSAAKPDFGIRYEHYDMFGSRNTFSLMGSITIPIVPWASKGYKSESVSMQQQVNAMNFEKQNLINQSRSEMHASLLHTLAEYEEVDHYEKEVIPSYRKAFESSLISYRDNNGSLLFTLMAWDDLNMAQMEYLYHLEQAYQSEIGYEHAIEKK